MVLSMEEQQPTTTESILNVVSGKVLDIPNGSILLASKFKPIGGKKVHKKRRFAR